jgi:hypothetical protein
MTNHPRPQALVVYESIFGNTRAIAEAIGRGLGDRYEVRVLEVSQAPAAPDGIDLIVVGGPIHAWGMTRESTRHDARKQALAHGVQPPSTGIGVREWLAHLPMRSDEMAAAAFDTAVKMRWFPVGSAGKGEAARLREHGYRVLVPPEHFFVADTDGPLVDGEVDRAAQWAAALAAGAAPTASAAPDSTTD